MEHKVINQELLVKLAFPIRLKKKIYEVEWLPGGCILHRRSNLIKKNYFKFKSEKAFCEDLFHSFYLKKKNIRLFVNTSLKCDFDSFKGFKTLSFFKCLNLMFQDFRIRFCFIRLVKKSIYRMIFYYFILFLD